MPMLDANTFHILSASLTKKHKHHKKNYTPLS